MPKKSFPLILALALLSRVSLGMTCPEHARAIVRSLRQVAVNLSGAGRVASARNYLDEAIPSSRSKAIQNVSFTPAQAKTFEQLREKVVKAYASGDLEKVSVALNEYLDFWVKVASQRYESNRAKQKEMGSLLGMLDTSSKKAVAEWLETPTTTPFPTGLNVNDVIRKQIERHKPSFQENARKYKAALEMEVLQYEIAGVLYTNLGLHGVMSPQDLLAFSDNQLVLAKIWLHENGIPFKETVVEDDGVRLKSLELSPNADPRILAVLKAMGNMDTGISKFYYSPAHNLIHGVRAAVTPDRVYLSTDFIAGLGGFEPNVWHEIRHLYFRSMLREGVPSPYHGELAFSQPGKELPIRGYTQGMLLEEISTHAFDVQSAHSKLKHLKDASSVDQVEAVHKLQNDAFLGVDISSHSRDYMKQAREVSTALERKFLDNPAEIALVSFGISSRRGIDSRPISAFGIQRKVEGGFERVSFALSDAKEGGATFVQAFVDLNGIVLNLPLFGDTVQADVKKLKELYEATAPDDQVAQVLNKLVTRLGSELQMRETIYHDMTQQFQNVFEASTPFVSDPSKANFDRAFQSLQGFRPHPIRKNDLEPRKIPPKGRQVTTE